MPRVPTSTVRRARALDNLLPLLLRPCRSLSSAQNELRWLRGHASCLAKDDTRKVSSRSWKNHLRHMCLERSRGKPLQYILGNQPFGELAILCRKDILIPRPETESITHYLAQLLNRPGNMSHSLSILDLCTGTGCISLLLHSLLAKHYARLEILGLDLSSPAIKLARKNVQHNVADRLLSPRAVQEIRFEGADIFKPTSHAALAYNWDVLVCNPPYISPRSFSTTTARSVRNYEPAIALVPPPQSSAQTDDAIGDSFYPSLLHIAGEVNARFFLVEVADMVQAERVASLVLGQERWKTCEIWRDLPEQDPDSDEEVVMGSKQVKVRGTGNGRAVFASSRG